MIETLLFSLNGGTGIYVPESGPGPKWIGKGDKVLGYFGVLSSSDLFQGSELANVVGLGSIGTLINDIVIWHKFAYNNRVLFIPQKPLKCNVAWSDIYARSLVYGIDGPGSQPYPPTSPVNQISLVSKGNDRFKVRLMSGTLGDGNVGKGGEYQDIFAKLSAADPSKTYWAKLTDNDLGVTYGLNGFRSHVKERALNSSVNYGRSVVTNDAELLGNTDITYGWRPVLDLVLSTDSMFSLIDLGYSVVTDAPIDVSAMKITYPSNVDGTIAPDSLSYTTDSLFDVSSIVVGTDPAAADSITYTTEAVIGVSSVLVTYS